MSATRIIQRRQWISDCPPIFNQRQREMQALRKALPKPSPRVTYRQWLQRRKAA